MVASLMAGALVFRSNPGWGHYVVFLGKTLNPYLTPYCLRGLQVKSSGIRQSKIYEWVSGRKGLREVVFNPLLPKGSPFDEFVWR